MDAAHVPHGQHLLLPLKHPILEHPPVHTGARAGREARGGIPAAAPLQRGFLLIWVFRGLQDKLVLKGGKASKEKRYLQNPPLQGALRGSSHQAWGGHELVSPIVVHGEKSVGITLSRHGFPHCKGNCSSMPGKHRTLGHPWPALAGSGVRGWQVSPVQPYRSASILP